MYRLYICLTCFFSSVFHLTHSVWRTFPGSRPFQELITFSLVRWRKKLIIMFSRMVLKPICKQNISRTPLLYNVNRLTQSTLKDKASIHAPSNTGTHTTPALSISNKYSTTCIYLSYLEQLRDIHIHTLTMSSPASRIFFMTISILSFVFTYLGIIPHLL